MESILIPKLKDNLHARAKQVGNYFLSKGFPYVKVELEANVRPDNYSSQPECDDCRGSGERQCWDCGGAGVVEVACSLCNGTGIVEAHDSEPHACSHCANGLREESCPNSCSDGQVSCEECGGIGHFDDELWHEDYHEAFWEVFKDRMGRTMELLEYSQIYYDGSVDTEITLTLHVDYLEKLTGIVSAFAETCEKFGGCDTGNAGLHIALLPCGKYPVKGKLDERKIANFKKQVSKLLLGLTCLGSPDSSTRAFEFRDLEISSDRKYSAIYTCKDTCLEYRLFDSCFNRPSYIIRYLELMSKTLHYYSHSPRRFLKLKDRISLERSNEILNKSYRGHHRKLADVFRTDESIAQLFKELTYLVERKMKFWLGCVYTLYSLGTISKQKLFSNLVGELKV